MWALISDSGSSIGPVIVGSLSHRLSLEVACRTIAVVNLHAKSAPLSPVQVFQLKNYDFPFGIFQSHPSLPAKQ